MNHKKAQYFARILILPIILSCHTEYAVNSLIGCTVHSLKNFAQIAYVNIASKLYFTSKDTPKTAFHNHPTYSLLKNSAIQRKEPIECPETIAAFRYITRKTFSQLPLMKIDEISTNAALDKSDNTIHLNEDLLQALPLSEKLKILLHEFRHFQQNKHAENSFSLNREFGDFFIPDKLQQFYPQQVVTQTKKHLDPSSASFNPWWQNLEYDADYWAVQQISCPICLKILQSKTTPSVLKGIIQYGYAIGDDKQFLGYFGFDDYISFIQQAKNNSCCPAHTKQADTICKENECHNEFVLALENSLDEMQDFMESLHNGFVNILNSPEKKKDPATSKNYLKENEIRYKKLYKKISELDQKTGSLLDHIPNYNKDMINSIQHEQKLWQIILNNEQKRREIKLLPKSCNPNAQIVL